MSADIAVALFAFAFVFTVFTAVSDSSETLVSVSRIAGSYAESSYASYDASVSSSSRAKIFLFSRVVASFKASFAREASGRLTSRSSAAGFARCSDACSGVSERVSASIDATGSDRDVEWDPAAPPGRRATRHARAAAVIARELFSLRAALGAPLRDVLRVLRLARLAPELRASLLALTPRHARQRSLRDGVEGGLSRFFPERPAFGLPGWKRARRALAVTPAAPRTFCSVSPRSIMSHRSSRVCGR